MPIPSPATIPGADVYPSAGDDASLSSVERAMYFIEAMLKPLEQPIGSSSIRAAQFYPADWTNPVQGTFMLDRPATVSGGVYSGYSVESHVLTDVDYLIHTQPANADNTFSFPFAQPGQKRFVLRRDSDGQMMAEDAIPFTNVRSYIVGPDQPGYGTDFARQSYSYDQAVALCAAIAVGDQALSQRLALGLLNFQTAGGTHDGGFIFSGRQEAPTYGDRSYRTGAHAVGVFSLLRYIQAYPLDTTRNFRQAAVRALDWMSAQMDPGGRELLTGGWGTYTDDGFGNQTFDPAEKLTWMSAEHNFDAYHAYKLADQVLGGYTDITEMIGNAVQTVLWDETRGQFLQGVKDDDTPDTADPLDTHSWGAIFCVSFGDLARAAQIMAPEFLEAFYYESYEPLPSEPGITLAASAPGPLSKGYGPFYDEPGYPGALPTVWSEGTFGVAYAHAKMGDFRYQVVLDGLLPAQLSDGGFYYVTDAMPDYELFPYESVIGAAWSVLAVLGTGIWDPPPRTTNLTRSAIGEDLLAALEPWMTDDLEAYVKAIGMMFAETETVLLYDPVQLEAQSLDEDELDLDTGYGQLLDPDMTPAAALPYLAQFVGERFPVGLNASAQRAWTKDRPNSRRGTLRSVYDAARRSLTGQRHVQIVERSDGTSGVDMPDDVIIYVYASECPDLAQVERDLRDTFPLELSVHVVVTTKETWQQAEIDHPTWDDMKAGGRTWSQVLAGD